MLYLFNIFILATPKIRSRTSTSGIKVFINILIKIYDFYAVDEIIIEVVKAANLFSNVFRSGRISAQSFKFIRFKLRLFARAWYLRSVSATAEGVACKSILNVASYYH